MHEKNFGQILKNWNFSVSIDRMPIELGRFKLKIFIAILIGRETALIDRKSGKVKIWKTMQVNAETPQSTLGYE